MQRYEQLYPGIEDSETVSTIDMIPEEGLLFKPWFWVLADSLLMKVKVVIRDKISGERPQRPLLISLQLLCHKACDKTLLKQYPSTLVWPFWRLYAFPVGSFHEYPKNQSLSKLLTLQYKFRLQTLSHTDNYFFGALRILVLSNVTHTSD